MGTSTRWKGPGGGPWSAAGGRLAQWNPDRPHAEERLEEIAADYLTALHQTIRTDRSAFGLYDAVLAAGDRLALQMSSLREEHPDSAEAFMALLAEQVGGDGGTVTDACIRRAAVAAGRDVLAQHPELEQAWASGDTGGRGFPSDILCDLYRLFFGDVVAEFLRSVVAEHVKLAVPVLAGADPGDQIADWIADQVLTLVPDPCEKAAEVTDSVDEAGAAVEAVENPVSVLPAIARSLVPHAARGVLGLITGEEETAA
ncbi:hypothetical protein [Streptomyces nanshensis]|uniref:Uncharacterized protein n=1 Tax=Streptomyces nanshensis TaxID=518642 RepID=A0A1E7KXR9_9ACTN|nr:hypothetical protein [Streptomyces nanshensis]OEV08716.1 hypothetical protein AN218_25290 [Streptomyces nanshensis]